MTQQQIIETGLLIVGAASVISNIMPPIEMFDPWPRFQRVYSILVYVVYHGAALNLRGPAARAFVINRSNKETSNGVKTKFDPPLEERKDKTKDELSEKIGPSCP